ncbi:MAG: hypothetical protein FIA98_16655 [Anaerolineae bacterium]|nr:hypothetical protein [Anaerolineae bacterium]
MPSPHRLSPFRVCLLYLSASAMLLLLTGCQQEVAETPLATVTVQALPTTSTPSTSAVLLPSDSPLPPEPTSTVAPDSSWVTVVIPSPEAEVETVNVTPENTPVPWRKPTPTPTPPFASLRIQKPGPYSKVTSPIPLRAVINPGDDKQVYIDLIGEDGRLITSTQLDFSHSTMGWVYTTADIPFEIQEVAETARLVLYTLDRYDRTIYQASVDLILIRLGDSDFNVSVVEQEPFIIRKPWEGATVRGGVLEVSGLVRPVNDQPLIIELFDEQGNLVGSAETPVNQPNDLMSHVPFRAYVPYTVTGWTPVRLTAHQTSATRIAGTVWLSSMLIYLQP